MTTTMTHPIAPEDIMAWLDGELDGAEAHGVHAHVAECAKCAALAEELKCTSQVLSEWKIPEAPSTIESVVMKALDSRTSSRKASAPLRPGHSGLFGRKSWAVGGAAVCVVFAVVALSVSRYSQRESLKRAQIMGGAQIRSELVEPSPVPESLSVDGFAVPDKDLSRAASQPKEASETKNGPLTPMRYSQPASAATPMIARTASLTILVKDFGVARGALDAIIAKHGGYSGNLTVDTPESGQRHFQASLRIPAGELPATLSDLKNLGRALSESQAGEEVTQQHADLVARLQNSRETEERLRAILQQRTGKIEDVLRVEEAIARVRGEIESMEAEQQVLEHRVTFATIDLQLVEEFKETFNPSPVSTSGRMRNAFVEGMRNASGAVLGLILFLEEFAPAILVWAAIFGLPAYFIWRRYRRVRDRF
jgi:hypothetical protein